MMRIVLRTFTVVAVLIGVVLPAAAQESAQGTANVRALLEQLTAAGAGAYVIVVPPGSGTLAPEEPEQPGVMYAGSSMTCGGKTYTVSTGNSSGTCTSSTGPSGNTQSVSCGDSAGNSASVSCNSAGTAGGCGNTSGAGSCAIK